MKKNDQNDLEIFKQAMKDVRPLIIKDKQAKIVFKKKLIPQKNIAIKSDAHTSLQDINLRNITSAEKLFFVRSTGGLQNNILQKLKQGKMTISQSLDLHGMIVNQARQAVEDFINTSRTQNHRYVLIIHGKGKSSESAPILKNHLYHWLTQISHVLAFCSAIPKDGGTGAVYVVLKKHLL